MKKTSVVACYTRNIQGHSIRLSLIEVSPDEIQLDSTNPRIGFSMRQLNENERSDAACTLLLTSQEDTEGLRRSIELSGGVQEPIYLRHDYTVAEGNRRVVAMRAAKEANPKDARFASMPAWLIPKGTPESLIQDLLNEECVPDEKKNPCTNPDYYYCDASDLKCHRRVPVIISPTVLELYNGQVASSHKLPRIGDIGEIVIELYEPEEVRARGVIGLGEPPVISPGAAISNAVCNALGVRVPVLPLTPERVLAAINGQKA